MRCRKCGQELAEDSVFCSNCGTPVSRKNKGYIVVAAIVSLVIIAGIAMLYATIHVNNTKEQVTSEEKSKMFKKKKIQKQFQKIIQLQIHIKMMIPLRIEQKILLEVNTS